MKHAVGLFLIVVLSACANENPDATPRPDAPRSLLVRFENVLAERLFSDLATELANTDNPTPLVQAKITEFQQAVDTELLTDRQRQTLGVLRDYLARQSRLAETPAEDRYETLLEVNTGLTVVQAHGLCQSELASLKRQLDQQSLADEGPLTNSESDRQAYLDLAFDLLSGSRSDNLRALTIQGQNDPKAKHSDVFVYGNDTLSIDLSDMTALPLYEISTQLRLFSVPGLHAAHQYPFAELQPAQVLAWAGYRSCRTCRRLADAGELMSLSDTAALCVADTSIHNRQRTLEQAQDYLSTSTYLPEPRLARHLLRLSEVRGEPSQWTLQTTGRVLLARLAAVHGEDKVLAILTRFGPQDLRRLEAQLSPG